jgi:hypothetical protein
MLHCLDVDHDYQVHVMRYVPYVSFATYRHAIVMTHLVCWKKKKGCHNNAEQQSVMYSNEWKT